MVKILPKRNDYFELEEQADQEIDPKQQILNAANEGCVLHRLYLDDGISEEQFYAGLAFAKLYSLSMRSLGVHNRVRTASKSWDQLHGIIYDQFSSRQIEGIWRYLLKALDPQYHSGIAMRQIAFYLVMSGQTIASPSLSSIRKTLGYLISVWEKIEAGPYRLGLYPCKSKPAPGRLN